MSEFFYVDLLVKSGPLNVNSLTWFFNIINRNPTYLRMSVKMILPVDFFPTGLTFSLKWRISSYRFLYLLYLHTSSQRKARENQLLFYFFWNWFETHWLTFSIVDCVLFADRFIYLVSAWLLPSFTRHFPFSGFQHFVDARVAAFQG